MYSSTQYTTGTTKYRLTDTEFVAEFDVDEKSYDNFAVGFWDALVECYEFNTTNIVGNLFLALKDHNWFNESEYYDVRTQREQLFSESKKLAKYREGIEKFMVLM